jgi:hypothetical protein
MVVVTWIFLGWEHIRRKFAQRAVGRTERALGLNLNLKASLIVSAMAIPKHVALERELFSWAGVPP